MKLDDNVVKRFAVAKLFQDNNDHINSLDFTPDGLMLVSSSEDDSIIIYDCQTGAKRRQVNSKKYGVDLIHFTHTPNTAIHSSTKVDDTVRYLSLLDNKYLRYFSGHTKKVVQLCMSPLDDTFISGSLDKTVRLWDLKSQHCQGYVCLTGRPSVGFDPEGLVFAIALTAEFVKLYDTRSFDKGPFNSFKFPHLEKDCEWTGLKFSPDGKTIMITTNSNAILLIDSFQGTLLHTLTDYVNENNIPMEACFSPDSAYVFSGSTDGKIYVWSVETGQLLATLSNEHTQSVHCIQFNPKFMLLATACSNLAFWSAQCTED